MAELLKNKYNYQSVFDLAIRIKTVYERLEVTNFINDIIDETWEDLSLKQRMRKITINLKKHLPDDYEQTLSILDQVVASYPHDFNDFTLMYFSDFVELYGQAECHWDLSIAALTRYTKYATSEFAVRPFIINNQERMLQQMLVWTKDENEHVRRLASEGSRPHLPWGKVLVNFKKNPLPLIKILEQLKTDSSLYVRKSVANSLNDISKTHSDLVIAIAKKWYGQNKNTDWIIKHACRTLLKKGNAIVMKLFGFTNNNFITINNFTVANSKVMIGESIMFNFEVQTQKAVKVRLEYAINYVRTNHKTSRKIFQISETQLEANQIKSFNKKHNFINLTTRKHYPGIHSLTLIVNGNEYVTIEFELI